MIKKKRKKLFIILVIIVSIALFLYAQLNWISVTKEDIYVNNLPSAFNGFKILQLSDLHSKSFGNDSNGIIKKINNIEPNIIVMTGDMRTNTPNDNGGVLITLLENLNGEYPVYYVTGEHEEGKYFEDENKHMKKGTKEAYEDRLEELGVIVLNDEKVQLGNGKEVMNIYGLKEKLSGSINIDNRLSKPNSQEVNILLAHTPDHFNEYVGWGADVIFSGDKHGGLIRLPFVGGMISSDGTFFPEYDGGLYRVDDSTMVVSRGLGNYFINIRVFNRPEIVVTTLKNK